MVLLMDGNNLLYRIIKAKSYPDLKTSSGQPTGGIYGTVQSVHHVWANMFPAHGIMVFDGGLSQRRLALRPDYKDRGMEDSESQEDRTLFYEQQQHISEILGYLGIPTVEVPGREADDVLDFLVHYLIAAIDPVPQRIVILSQDIDLCQILGRGSAACEIELFRPISEEVVTRHNIHGILGYPLEYYPWCKALVGKPREVKGIEGVGEKTAVSLINGAHEKGVPLRELVQQYLDEGSKKPMKRLQTIMDNWEEVERGVKLSTIRLEQFTDDEQVRMAEVAKRAFVPGRVSSESLRQLTWKFNELEFLSIANNLTEWARPFMGG